MKGNNEPRSVAEAIINAKENVRKFIASLNTKKITCEKITCENCTHLDYDNDGSTFCCLGISKSALESFNEQNIRPCKEVR